MNGNSVSVLDVNDVDDNFINQDQRDTKNKNKIFCLIQPRNELNVKTNNLMCMFILDFVIIMHN